MTSAALADGFKDARAGEATFEVSKKTKPSVTFTSKAPGETFKGAGKEMSGTLTLDPSKLDAATGEFAVPFKSIDTGIGGRNKHMLSARWIDAALVAVEQAFLRAEPQWLAVVVDQHLQHPVAEDP